MNPTEIETTSPTGSDSAGAPEARTGAPSRRTGPLTRDAIVQRALELGTAEGLEAVSLRRLAADLGVTPMALYRHVRDKQDLVNAMTDAVLEDFDLMAGVDRSLPWAEQARLAMRNYKREMDARPLALPLSIAYTGEDPKSFWRMLEDLLDIFLAAGFPRRQAIVLIRVISNLLAGYFLLLRQDNPLDAPGGDQRIELIKTQSKLAILSLPRAEFPNLVDAADEVADVWISDPDRWWEQTVDLVVLGLERLLSASA